MLVTCHTVVPQAITRHKDQPDVLEQGIGCTAVVCLRAPEHAEKLAEMGIIPIIAQAMKQHPMAVGVQRQSCLAVRNLVSRKKELIDQMLASSVELFLEEAYNKFPKCKDVAYAAMRDMGLL
ncbi:Armc6 [Symbiodinium sp. KB8]|nr:Armc6 [Symbiodinium sp. KB8]